MDQFQLKSSSDHHTILTYIDRHTHTGHKVRSLNLHFADFLACTGTANGAVLRFQEDIVSRYFPCLAEGSLIIDTHTMLITMHNVRVIHRLCVPCTPHQSPTLLWRA